MTGLKTTPGCGSAFRGDEDDEPRDPRFGIVTVTTFCAGCGFAHLPAWVVDRWAVERRPLAPARYR